MVIGSKEFRMKLFVRILAILVVGWAALSSIPAPMNAQAANKAALVIRHAEGDVQTACVTFEEPQISGLNLLSRADLDLVINVQSGGALVCKIKETGCPASDCWCQCKGGGDCIYWSYWHILEDGWTYSQGGAAVYMIEDGSVDGWSWGPGSITEAVPPPDITFDEVCLAEATNTPTATSSPLPIIISPQPTVGGGSVATKTEVPPSPSATAAASPTAQATEITLSTFTPTQVALPAQPAATRPQKITETPSLQQEQNEAPATASSGAIAAEPTGTIEIQPSLMPSATPLVTVEMAPIVTAETAQRPAKIADVGESAARTEEIESENQRTIVGSEFAIDNEPQQTELGANNAAGPPERGYDWLSYAGFFVIVSALTLLLVWLKRKRKLS